ncbi:hypothetical protein E3T39_00020 [Cryobacterium suzukii]|uniref:Oligosaccharide repeat unit polymerase n=1 Tax=Cryobacterium suzukii TaxID=1259198 RepID=A0A4R9AJA5_9MICO|nr:hypothetical protein [Cryobacterium suzukii]TFD63135.1 hypothetical protein E3T39_00020 [Cryobacterium suzukii]
MFGSGRHKSSLSDTVSSQSRLLPLKVFTSWWALCFVFYIVGWPIDYVRTNAVWVTLLTGACLLGAIGGYAAAVARHPFRTDSPASDWRVPWVVRIGLVASLVLVFPLASVYSGFSVLDVGSAIQNQGAAFAQASERMSEGLGARTGILLLQSALAPFTLSVIPFLSLAWFEGRRHGILLVLALVAPLTTSFLVGRDQQIAFSLIVLSGAWALSRVRRRLPLRWREVTVLALVAVAMIISFGARRLARNSVDPICAPGGATCTIDHSYPNVFEAAWVNIMSYATQGFEGLGRAMDATWVFGGGFSHSRAVESLLSKTFNFESAPVVTSQLDSLGWSGTGYWSTAFTSIANDVPWILIPLVIFFQAFLLGSAWRRSLRQADWLSTSVLCYTWLAMMFVPQNLQLAVSGPIYLGYIMLVALYLLRSVAEYGSSNTSKRFGPVSP